MDLHLQSIQGELQCCWWPHAIETRTISLCDSTSTLHDLHVRVEKCLRSDYTPYVEKLKRRIISASWKTSLSHCLNGVQLIICFWYIAFYFSDNEESDKILVKTMFRRSRAFTELGYYFRALNDISYCLRNQAQQVHQTPGVNNFQSYYWEVRTS